MSSINNTGNISNHSNGPSHPSYHSNPSSSPATATSATATTAGPSNNSMTMMEDYISTFQVQTPKQWKIMVDSHTPNSIKRRSSSPPVVFNFSSNSHSHTHTAPSSQSQSNLHSNSSSSSVLSSLSSFPSSLSNSNSSLSASNFNANGIAPNGKGVMDMPHSTRGISSINEVGFNEAIGLLPPLKHLQIKRTVPIEISTNYKSDQVDTNFDQRETDTINNGNANNETVKSNNNNFISTISSNSSHPSINASIIPIEGTGNNSLITIIDDENGKSLNDNGDCMNASFTALNNANITNAFNLASSISNINGMSSLVGSSASVSSIAPSGNANFSYASSSSSSLSANTSPTGKKRISKVKSIGSSNSRTSYSRPLTFHQLVFDADTLKASERSSERIHQVSSVPFANCTGNVNGSINANHSGNGGNLMTKGGNTMPLLHSQSQSQSSGHLLAIYSSSSMPSSSSSSNAYRAMERGEDGTISFSHSHYMSNPSLFASSSSSHMANMGTGSGTSTSTLEAAQVLLDLANDHSKSKIDNYHCGCNNNDNHALK